MIEEVFAQTTRTVCGVGTHSITENGILTCVLNDVPATGSYSGISPTLDFSTPDAIQESMFESLLPNLIQSAQTNLSNVFEASPILLEALIFITSLAGIIPISAGVIAGMVLLFKKMRYNKRENDQKIFQQDKPKRFSFKMPKFNLKKKKPEVEETISSELTEDQTKKVAEIFDDTDDKVSEIFDKKDDYDQYLKELEAEQVANDFHDSLAEDGITPKEIQDEIDSKERDLDVITDPKEYEDTAKEIEEMVDDKKAVEENLEATGGFITEEILEPVREEVKDPDKMSLEDLEKQIKEKGHNVEIKDDEIEITENPELTVIEKPSDQQIVKTAVEQGSKIMEDELDSVLNPKDFNPSEKEMQLAKEHFEQPDPSEEEIIEVQKLVKEGMSQDDAINLVVRKAQEKRKKTRTLDFQEIMTEEEQVIDDMENERDIFKLDIVARKPSKFKSKFEKTSLGKKVYAKGKAKEKELNIKTKFMSVLNDLGHKRMVEYSGKINEKMNEWAKEQNLNEKAKEDLRKFSLFASMCEMMADQKTSKKRYWKKIIKYDIS